MCPKPDRKPFLHRRRGDEGFTLIELLIVIAILGILSTIVVLSVKGINDRGKKSTCKADYKTLEVAYEAAVANGQVWTAVAPATVEGELKTAGLLRTVSSNYDIDATGNITVDAAGTNGCASPPTS